MRLAGWWILSHGVEWQDDLRVEVPFVDGNPDSDLPLTPRPRMPHRILPTQTLLAALTALLAPASLANQFGTPPHRIAPPATAEPTGESLVRTELLADVPAIRPGGTFHLAVLFSIEPGWHIYWRNSGDSGGPPTIRLDLPEGFSAEPVRWPAPRVFQSDEVTFGYVNRAILFIPVDVHPEWAGGDEVTITADLRWLVCKEACLLGRRSERITLPIAEPIGAVPEDDRVRGSESGSGAGESRDATVDGRVAEGLLRLPRSAESSGVRAVVEGEHLVLAGPASDGAAVVFLPIVRPGVEFEATLPPPTMGRGGTFELRLPFRRQPQNAMGQPLRLAGAILVGDPDRPEVYTEIELPLDG